MTEQATAPAPGTPEHDAAMAARFRASKEPDAPAANEIADVAARTALPEGVPAKFVKDGVVDVAALAASYAALEKRLGAGGATAAPAATPGDQPAPAADNATESTACAAVQKAGLDWDALAAKAGRGEAFSAEEYAALEAAGMPRHVADGIAKALTDRGAAERQAAVEYAGGQAQADALMDWAAKNLSEAEKQTYNQLLASPQWRIAVDSLRSRAGASLPTAGEPTLVTGGNQAGRPEGYRSRSEMKSDMANPLYQRDPAFREKVAMRMRFATWDLDR
jgi:hypothetical protein